MNFFLISLKFLSKRFWLSYHGTKQKCEFCYVMFFHAIAGWPLCLQIKLCKIITHLSHETKIWYELKCNYLEQNYTVHLIEDHERNPFMHIKNKSFWKTMETLINNKFPSFPPVSFALVYPSSLCKNICTSHIYATNSTFKEGLLNHLCFRGP